MRAIIVVLGIALAALFGAGAGARRGYPFFKAWLASMAMSAILSPFVLVFVPLLRRAKNVEIVPCSACQAPVSQAATACPQCGHPTGSRGQLVRDSLAMVVGGSTMLLMLYGVALNFGWIE
jgi:hypothetical protein